MDPSAWLASFKSLNEQMKTGALTDEQTKKYFSLRDELALSVVTSQGTTVPKEHRAHSYIKVQQMWPIEINNLYQSVTKEVWPKGFVALVPSNIPQGSSVEFSLKIRREQGVSGKGIVVSSVRQPGNFKVVVAIDTMAQASVEMLEGACLDAFLARL